MLPFAAPWTDLENIMHGEINQTKTNTVWYHLNVESQKKNKWINIQNRKRLRHRKQTLVYQKGGEGKELIRSIGSIDINYYI